MSQISYELAMDNMLAREEREQAAYEARLDDYVADMLAQPLSEDDVYDFADYLQTRDGDINLRRLTALLREGNPEELFRFLTDTLLEVRETSYTRKFNEEN